MNKQKLFQILSTMGLIFMIALGVGYFQSLKTRGDIVENKVMAPSGFANQFSRVITKNRLAPMEDVSFLSSEGEQISWDKFKGKYLLVNFWATWCAPCVVELPSLQRLKERFEDEGLEVIAISIDQGRSHDNIKEFLYYRNIDNFAAYFDNKIEIQSRITMRGIPTTYLLDPEGNVTHIFEGDASWHSPSGLAFFKEILASE